MSSLSIRARLTIVIVLVTALISAVGVLFGLRALESQVRASAIDARRDEFELVSSDFEELDGVEIFFEDGGFIIFDEASDEAFAATFGIDEFSMQAELEFLAAALSKLNELPQLIEQIGTPEGSVVTWLAPGILAEIGPDGPVGFIEPDDARSPVIPVNDLFLLEEKRFGPGGTTDAVDLDLEIVTETVDDMVVAFVAEVSDEVDAFRVVRNTLTVVVVALTLLAGLATWFIAGRALRPVGAITNRVDDITSGTLSDRVPEPAGNDEIGVLARTMNRMLSRLENADLRRRQFVSDASHELRTPVAVLRSEAEVALRAPDSTSLDELSNVVLGESQRLERLVEDLLSLARSDEASELRSPGTVDVDEIVLQEAGRTRRLPVDVSAVSGGRVHGHDDDVQRIVAHLLDNAARHANDVVAVGLRIIGDTVQLWVDDDGPGIPADQRSRVFDRFIRLDEARSRDAGGAGLGLSVVSETVRRLGGIVRIDEAPAGGARFVVELPTAES